MSKNKAFTLFEIIIVIILVSIIYTFAINSFSKNKPKHPDGITLSNLKEKLLEFEFDEDITIQCLADDFSCFVFLDDDLEPQEEKIKDLFKNKPTIYSYSKELERLEFLDLELEQLQRYEIIFKYNCKKNKKCSELIVETDNLVYIFNDIKNKPKTIKYISDIDSFFDNKIQEVKDAF